MTEEKRRILDLLEQGKLTAREAAMLLDEIEEKVASSETDAEPAQETAHSQQEREPRWVKLEDSIEELGDSIEGFVQRTVSKMVNGFGKATCAKERSVHIEIGAYRNGGEPLEMEVCIPLKVAHQVLKWNEMIPEEAKKVLRDKGLDYTNQEFLDVIAAMEETGGDVINFSQCLGKAEVDIHIFVD